MFLSRVISVSCWQMWVLLDSSVKGQSLGKDFEIKRHLIGSRAGCNHVLFVLQHLLSSSGGTQGKTHQINYSLIKAFKSFFRLLVFFFFFQNSVKIPTAKYNSSKMLYSQNTNSQPSLVTKCVTDPPVYLRAASKCHMQSKKRQELCDGTRLGMVSS